ncbi:DUF4340 domain-containing protein [Treponema sp. OttesenSCG-928-L16]|nr:DUF4340 domain-containing protein [Treponema sp. OttesenSCG-928-L16]
MAYRKKLIILSSAAAILALAYILSFVFDGPSRDARNSAYVWLPAELADQASRLELSSSPGISLVLVRNQGLWFVSREGREFPAKQARVEDLFRILSSKGLYPVRAASASAHERLGLGDSASRISVYGGINPRPLLDLRIGYGDSTGQEIYLRNGNRNEVRSGKDLFSSYLSSSPSSWLNLRLFQNEGAPALNAGMVQRFRVRFPLREEDTASGEGAQETDYTLSRDAGRSWIMNGRIEEALDNQKIESYLRSVLDAEGDDFIPSMDVSDPVFLEGTVVLEMEDGTVRSIRLGPAAEAKRKSAAVSGSPFVYLLSEWTLNRIFREKEYFYQQNL